MGRWTSPDWAAKPEAVPYSSLDNPQSLNLYEYVGNNPLSRADADGHDWDGFKSALVKAYSEVSAKASFGLGIGLASKGVGSGAKAEAAVKYSILTKAGKLQEHLSAEIGVTEKSGGVKRGLGASADKVMGTIDTNTGTSSDSEPITHEWTVGSKSGGTSLDVHSPGDVSFGTEAGEGLLGGGEISISKEGIEALGDAWGQLKDALTPQPQKPPPTPDKTQQ